jgi:hypothetical protein
MSTKANSIFPSTCGVHKYRSRFDRCTHARVVVIVMVVGLDYENLGVMKIPTFPIRHAPSCKSILQVARPWKFIMKKTLKILKIKS